MVESVDNSLQKIPKKEAVNNTVEKVRRRFFDFSTEMKSLQWYYIPPNSKNKFLFMTNFDAKEKTIKISMVTINKLKNTRSESIEIIMDKDWFTIIEWKIDKNWFTLSDTQNKILNWKLILPYLDKIQKKYTEFQKFEFQKTMILVESTTHQEADKLLMELQA